MHTESNDEDGCIDKSYDIPFITPYMARYVIMQLQQFNNIYKMARIINI